MEQDDALKGSAQHRGTHIEVGTHPAFAFRRTRRDIHHEVWSLAWPSVATMLLQTVNSLLDVFFVGRLPQSRQALAATGVGGQVIFLLISLAMGVSVGTTALVARFIGGGDRDSASKATSQSISLSLVLSTICFLVFYSSRNKLVGWLLHGSDGAAAGVMCSQFLGAALLATVPLFLMNALMGSFRGLGDTRSPMLIQAAVITTHISFNIILIYGYLGFPRMGVQGAGAAFFLSIVVGTFLYFFALIKRTPISDSLKISAMKLKYEWVQRILKIGIPAAIQSVIRTLGMMSFTGLLARTLEGSAGVAAMQIGLRAEALAFMPGFGYSVAAAALVGQSMGAKDIEGAEEYGWAANMQGVGVMSFMAMLFFVFAHPISALFTTDPTVQKLSAAYLQINAFCEPFIAIGIVLTGALQGAGDTLRPTFITFITMWVLRLPLAYLFMFTFNMQTVGAWYSMLISTTLAGLMTLSLFRGGKWKSIKV